MRLPFAFKKLSRSKDRGKQGGFFSSKWYSKIVSLCRFNCYSQTM